MRKGISIIICCYNSELRLPKTLECLAKQEVNQEIPVELIVVNNASTDRTKDTALSEWRKYHTHFLFRIIDEETPGQMFARQRGGLEAQYEYILFCDDDNWLQPNYLQTAFELMESNSQIGALSGQTIAVSDIELPEWFPDFQMSWAVGKQANTCGDVSSKGWIWGAGMMTRRDLLNKVLDRKYPFVNQGRTGDILTSGDDCEICKRILLMGYALYYDDSLLLYHYMPANRLTWVYKKNLFSAIELSDPVLAKYDLIRTEMNKSVLHKIKGILYFVLKTLFKRNHLMIKELYAKISFMLKTDRFTKDLEYKRIINFVLYNRSTN